jgi:hypothetical protein
MGRKGIMWWKRRWEFKGRRLWVRRFCKREVVSSGGRRMIL